MSARPPCTGLESVAQRFTSVVADSGLRFPECGPNTHRAIWGGVWRDLQAHGALDLVLALNVVRGLPGELLRVEPSDTMYDTFTVAHTHLEKHVVGWYRNDQFQFLLYDLVDPTDMGRALGLALRLWDAQETLRSDPPKRLPRRL